MLLIPGRWLGLVGFFDNNVLNALLTPKSVFGVTQMDNLECIHKKVVEVINLFIKNTKSPKYVKCILLLWGSHLG